MSLLPGLLTVSGLLLTLSRCIRCNRHSVHWNSSNALLKSEDYTVTVNVNDYLDIYCPHYNASGPRRRLESYVLYMVNREGYRTCNHRLGFKRWECSQSHAPHSPIKFSEKFQRYSAFSLGYEFHVGQEYYYISTPTHHHGQTCLRMRVSVCCATSPHPRETLEPTPPPLTVGHDVKSVKDLDEFKPALPKLERSVSGSGPCRKHLCLTVVLLLLLLFALVAS